MPVAGCMMDNDIEKLIHDWRNSVGEYAAARADMIYLTEFRKSKKAILMNQAQAEGIKTGQERESYAYAHADYLTLLIGLKEATEKSEGLRYRMKIAEERVGIWRTKQASSRKEQHSYGA